MRLRMGLSRAALAFSPSLLFSDMSEKSKTKVEVNPREIAMKAGAEAGGAVKRVGTLDGRFERSISNFILISFRSFLIFRH